MKTVFSPRGTGACPLCKKRDRCVIKKDMEKTLENIPGNVQKKMELVVYICPSFIEE